MKVLLIFAILLQSLAAVAQLMPEKRVFPENDTSKMYTVAGERHGLGFFPKVKYSHVRYEASPALTFDKFHSADVVYTYMRRFAETYPDLVEFYQVTESFEGRPIYQMTLTNKKTGKATDKPGAFFEGNRHSGEVTSTESVLWLMQYLLVGYGKDDVVTKLLDKNTIYLRPINNPDGHNLYMHTAQANRSTVRPFDEDGDGLLDEDGRIDLNGDGKTLRMRYKDPKGDYVKDPRDPQGRLMKFVGEGKGDYKVVQEGLDQDGDGKIAEDGIGGLDLHRNYPENWRPIKEATGHGWTQGYSGQYPLSEIETRAVVLFLLANPNIYVVNSMDTSVPMHLRPPSTSKSEDRMYPEDLKWYKLFDEIGKSITGYERAGDVYNDYSNGNLSPLFGHGPDFGYFYYGAIWYGDELWNNGRTKDDLNGDGIKDELDQYIWDEKENDGLGFTPWTPFNHPTLGEVEIGGWDPKFFTQNAPSKHLEPWAKNEALFNLEMIRHLPELEWADAEVKQIKAYKGDSVDYRVRIAYKNVGKLPTALKQAHLVKIVKPDRLDIQFTGDLSNLADGKAQYKILDNTLSQPRMGGGRGMQGVAPAPSNSFFKEVGFADGESTNAGEFRIRVYHAGSLGLKATLTTTRAGQLKEKEINIR
ncbi:peptidase M14 [Bacteroidia bacterium]|nr:peptidase M14 [Bacteroidia bacterium]